MQKFEYRAPRYQVDLPVSLTLPSSTLQGRCREISKEGMKAELPEPVSPETRDLYYAIERLDPASRKIVRATIDAALRAQGLGEE